MSREVVVRKRCDVCGEDASATYVGTIGEGEERPPRLAVLDVCDAHGQPLRDVAASFGAAPVWNGGAPRLQAKRARADGANAPYHCDVCGQAFAGKKALTDHVWALHAGGTRPNRPEVCAICGKRLEDRRARGVHARMAHGVDSLAEAYAAARALAEGA